MRENRFLVFLLVLCFSGSFLHAQKTSFVPGYVVTIDMDTLRGVLKIFRPDIANGRVTFRDTYGVKTNYYPKNLFCYKIGNDSYVSKTLQKNSSVIGGSKGFMQVRDTGAVNLYFYYYEVNSEKSYQSQFDPAVADYFISIQDIDSTDVYNPSAYNNDFLITEPLSGDFYIERKGQWHQLIKPTKFKKQMMQFFEDDPLLVDVLKKKQLKFEDIIFMVQVYNRKKIEGRE